MGAHGEEDEAVATEDVENRKVREGLVRWIRWRGLEERIDGFRLRGTRRLDFHGYIPLG